MKKKFYLVAGFLFLIANILLLAQNKKWIETDKGSFRIERFWEETVGDYTCTYTLITYRNTTNKTFEQNVTIRASVYDSKENMIDSNTRSFFAHERGPIKPGFEGVLKIPIECKKNQSHSVSVVIEQAR